MTKTSSPATSKILCTMVLTKRIIPCLDLKGGRVVKGTHFTDLRDAGDPVELARRYNEQGADEVIFLDIAASKEHRALSSTRFSGRQPNSQSRSLSAAA